MSLEISLAFFVFHVSVYDKDLDPMITLNKRFKTPVRKIFPRFIACRRLRTQGRCRKLLRLCWPRYTPFRVCCITFQCFDIRLKNSFRYITFRCLDIR